ncbi:DEAD/DEAH box helicase [Streptomyces sp. NBC_01261]|uniref:DEAD/DEAH box helicase n=1 Tax=Streptomyces sp. NBC_01261 TaxID=2903802 RepID=UPI002E34307F|nr:DEAD/DEAH box helicase [Streptomyces sp. NBC_01261]
MAAEHAPLSAALQYLVELVVQAPDGLTRGELAAAARERYARLPGERISKLLEEAFQAGALTERVGRIRGPEPDASLAEAVAVPLPREGFRAVALDLESAVRTTATEPWTERRIFQIGAVRLGADEWVKEQPRFECWTKLPELPDAPWEINDPARRKRHDAEAVDIAEALEALRAYCVGAEFVIAHNGTAADFPLLDEECARAGLAVLDCTRADSLYVAHVLLPTVTSHRLADVADELATDRRGLALHDAVDDAELLARLLRRAAQVYGQWPAERRELLAAVCPDSPAWRLLRRFAGEEDRTMAPWTPADTAAVVGRSLASHVPRRGPATGIQAGRGQIVVAERLCGSDGRVDPTALAAVVHGGEARPRPAQQEMSATLHTWCDAAVPGLVEAPTGTGKSYAVLAAALDWLAGGSERTAVVATYTKQLQTQLAKDVEILDKAVPGLTASADLVKGSANRISLRMLTTALAEATTVGSGAAARAVGVNHRFVQRHEYRELLAYLWLRLAASQAPPLSWTARSVDPVDIPAHFGDSIGAVLPLWLQSLSQSAGGEYRAGAATPLAEHTDAVREALASHRLLLANHALVLTHLDDLRALPGEVLLVIDEAHQLEDAATSALTISLDYAAIEDLAGECAAWLREARSGVSRDRVTAALQELELLLDHEQLPRAAAQAFDGSGSGGSRVGSRTVTLASAYSGSSGVRAARDVERPLVVLAALAHKLGAAFAAYGAEHGRLLDFFAQERLDALYDRVKDTAAAARDLIDDLDTVLGPPGTTSPRTASEEAPPQVAADDSEQDDTAAADDEVLGGGPEQEAFPGLPPVLNRVVHAEELEVPRPGLRRYRFRLSSSPVELPADPAWRQFREAFARTYYVSATLRVAGSWDFVRERLGLAESMATVHLPTPFRLEEQAELVCLADFPSWAEQQEGAMRTVAHQLAGYAELAVHPAPARESGGWDGGALVLTTARSTAGGIGELLTTELRRRSHDAPVRNALTLGNGRAFADFTDRDHGGGFLVGTRGLWQGIDVSDAHRLRLVWINKLPFAPFAAPIIEARRAAVRARAEAACEEDPDAYATRHYYLPLAAIQLRQAVGRLIRSDQHRGVIVISDRKLAGQSALRRAYRQAFLGSLEPGLLRLDQVTGEPGGGNVVPMAEGWARIWTFLARNGVVPASRADELTEPAALLKHTLLPQTRRIRELALSTEEAEELRSAGTLEKEVLRRCAETAGLLRLMDHPEDFRLKPAQQAVIGAVAAGQNVLALLPTGYGKSFTFQLPALVMPGVTIVVSPLVALMQDQALELNRSIGGAVRALVAPMRESSSRAGKTEVAEQLEDRRDHGIKIVYVSPERLCQSRFRGLVRDAVKAGIVTRIALDEAHTMVQWDDFRPSMGRVERFLAELRQEYALPVTALTATANRTVQAGLREGVFGLAADPPPLGSESERNEQERSGVNSALVTVRENPIRPELALFRRTLQRSGSLTAARLAEEVVDALQDHAVLYCLTVKEVVALHAHLRDYLGETGIRIRRFHGRLTEVEKAAVMTEFREAPRRGEEGFTPLVVVATAAFGLGIDRDDIRTVFCVSAPTDMAALYQQLGRAGRDVAGSGVQSGKESPRNAGLALLTGGGLRTVAWMTGTDLAPELLERMSQAVLDCRGGVLDAGHLADAFIGQELAAGRLTEEDARLTRTVGSYTTGVMRTFSALADRGLITDFGDFPPRCTVRPGELPPGDADVEAAVVAAVLALPGRAEAAGGLNRGVLDVARLDVLLARTVDGYRHLSVTPAETWQLLADLHDRGVLDVSAAPSRSLVTGLEVRGSGLPGGFLRLLNARAERAARETALLRDYFEDSSTCAHRKFADYFGVTELPDGCCTTAWNRCSACWEDPSLPLDETRPAVARALATPVQQLRGASTRADAEHLRRRLDEQVYRLVWTVHRGLHPRTVWRALKGEDSWYSPVKRRSVRLHPALSSSRHFGSHADLIYRQVQDSLERLAAEGRVLPDEHRWRADAHLSATRTAPPAGGTP